LVIQTRREGVSASCAEVGGKGCGKLKKKQIRGKVKERIPGRLRLSAHGGGRLKKNQTQQGGKEKTLPKRVLGSFWGKEKAQHR